MKVTPQQEDLLKAMMSAFRMLGPIESLDWVAEYFKGFQTAMARHRHPAPWCDTLVADVRALVAKYKARNAATQATGAQTVPAMTEHEVDLADLVVVESDNVYEVCSWRDGPARSGVPCTEVHLLLRIGGGSVALRLKSTRALDELVGALLQHRKDVWGGPSTAGGGS